MRFSRIVKCKPAVVQISLVKTELQITQTLQVEMILVVNLRSTELEITVVQIYTLLSESKILYSKTISL